MKSSRWLLAVIVLSAQAPVRLADELFDEWLDNNDAVYLNSIPVQWGGQARTTAAGADQRGPGGF